MMMNPYQPTCITPAEILNDKSTKPRLCIVGKKNLKILATYQERIMVVRTRAI